MATADSPDTAGHVGAHADPRLRRAAPAARALRLVRSVHETGLAPPAAAARSAPSRRDRAWLVLAALRPSVCGQRSVPLPRVRARDGSFLSAARARARVSRRRESRTLADGGRGRRHQPRVDRVLAAPRRGDISSRRGSALATGGARRGRGHGDRSRRGGRLDRRMARQRLRGPRAYRDLALAAYPPNALPSNGDRRRPRPRFRLPDTPDGALYDPAG